MFRLSRTEAAHLDALLEGLSTDPRVLQMQSYRQHGSVSTYAHCRRVARVSYWLNDRLGLHAAPRSLVRGAMLHDFYLYDWHDCHTVTRLHGFTHPEAALRNAERCFPLGPTERDIIATHMWPLTWRHRPACRESAIVCLADKLCALHETLFAR